MFHQENHPALGVPPHLGKPSSQARLSGPARSLVETLDDWHPGKQLRNRGKFTCLSSLGLYYGYILYIYIYMYIYVRMYIYILYYIILYYIVYIYYIIHIYIKHYIYYYYIVYINITYSDMYKCTAMLCAEMSYYFMWYDAMATACSILSSYSSYLVVHPRY